MHIASALGVPTVAVFGATDDTTTGPTGPLARVVREHAECAPCLLRECPIDHRCMTRVTPERVLAAGRQRAIGTYGSVRPRMLTYEIFTPAKTASGSILVVRLGAMGDIIHALPAVASLKHNYPGSRLTWAVEPRWAPLLAGNPFIDRLVFIRRDTLSRVSRELARPPLRAVRFRRRFPGPFEIGPDRHLRASAADLRFSPDADPRTRRRPLLLR